MWKTLDLIKYTKNVVLLATVWIHCTVVFVEGCGQFIELNGGAIHGIGVSNSYAPYSNCIWVIEASYGYRVQLNITSFEGQQVLGSCADYITIRDGSESSNEVLSPTCSTITNTAYTSTARWMWIQFKSDGETTTTGLSGVLSTVYAGASISNYSSPLESCKSHQYKCENHICLTRAYLCDGFEDCGCNGCDEHGCEGLGWTTAQLMGMSVGLGTAISIGIFLFSCLWEKYRKLKAMRQGALDMDPLESKKSKIAWHK